MSNEPTIGRYRAMAARLAATRDEDDIDMANELLARAAWLEDKATDDKRQAELRTMVREVTRTVASGYQSGGFVSATGRRTYLNGKPVDQVQEVVGLIGNRIMRGTMPCSRAELLEQRGDMERAARDLAAFGSVSYDDALAALLLVYREESNDD